MKNKLIVANWKLHPATQAEALKLARVSDHKNVVICPPFLFLAPIGKSVKRAALGAQDVFWEEKGPHTGEVSAQMLKGMGVQYVIVGHSERRKMGETDGMVSAKVTTALMAGLRVILCVGEPLHVHKKGLAVTKRFVQQQLTEDLRGISHLERKSTQLVVTYEPVWAISGGKRDVKGRADKPEDAVVVIRFIKKILNSRFKIRDSRMLYGGSVNAKNAKSFLKYKEIGGALVGGASLRPKEFLGIIRAA